MAITSDHIRDKLIKELAAVHVDVEDTSPNRCAASYKVLVVSSQFEGKPLLQRHSMQDVKVRAEVAVADVAAFVEEGIGPAEKPLVAVSFQRNVRRKEKYLEAEPKALGITQIGLSAFQITCVATFLSNGLTNEAVDIVSFISSLLVVIAGSVAIAARNLHLPTLRACLGMQIVAAGASVFNLICSLITMDLSHGCWDDYIDSNSSSSEEACHKVERANTHFFAETLVLQVALFAISVTLAAYCCKVVNCCTPAPKVPVITVHVPSVQQ